MRTRNWNSEKRRKQYGEPWSDFTPSPQEGFCRLVPGGPPMDMSEPEVFPPRVELPDDARPLLPRFWEFALLVWNEITGMLGWSSVELIERRIVPYDEGRAIRDWVLNLELFVRRVLLITAILLPLNRQPSRRLPKRSQARSRPDEMPDPKDPTTWRVSFTLFRIRFRPVKDTDAWGVEKSQPPPRDRRPRPLFTGGLAFRVEALRRVLSNSEPYIRRSALRLARLADAIAHRRASGRYTLRKWNRNWPKYTLGQRAILQEMQYAQPLAERMFERWQLRWLEPG